MRVAFCTNIRPVADPAGLRGRNHAIIEALRAAGHDVDVLHGRLSLARSGPDGYDVGLLCPNDLFEALPDPSGRVGAETVALAIERAGVPFVNSPLRRRFATNKLLAHMSFLAAGLSQPDFWAVEELDALPWRPDGLMVKPVTGSGGVGVALARSRQQALAHVQATEEPCFLQQFIPDARCIRVISTREDSVGRYEKRVPRGTVVAGITAGATEVKLPPRDDLDRLAIDMTRAVEMDVVGADILEAADGRVLALEVNVNFGFYPRNGEIVDALVRQVESRAEEGAREAERA